MMLQLCKISPQIFPSKIVSIFISPKNICANSVKNNSLPSGIFPKHLLEISHFLCANHGKSQQQGKDAKPPKCFETQILQMFLFVTIFNKEFCPWFPLLISKVMLMMMLYNALSLEMRFISSNISKEITSTRRNLTCFNQNLFEVECFWGTFFQRCLILLACGNFWSGEVDKWDYLAIDCFIVVGKWASFGVLFGFYPHFWDIFFLFWTLGCASCNALCRILWAPYILIIQDRWN